MCETLEILTLIQVAGWPLDLVIILTVPCPPLESIILILSGNNC